MSYEYAVVWFRKEKFFFADKPRPINPQVAVFHSLKRAKKFAKDRRSFNGGKASIYAFKLAVQWPGD